MTILTLHFRNLAVAESIISIYLATNDPKLSVLPPKNIILKYLATIDTPLKLPPNERPKYKHERPKYKHERLKYKHERPKYKRESKFLGEPNTFSI